MLTFLYNIIPASVCNTMCIVDRQLLSCVIVYDVCGVYVKIQKKKSFKCIETTKQCEQRYL